MNSRTATTLPYKELPVADGNYDSNRTTIDRIVIHTMVGTVSSAAGRFNTVGSQVSAHYGVGLDGTLYHFLEEYLVAYHAGNYPMNQRSIGIEHEDNGDYNGTRTDALYTTSAKLVRDICQFYGIPVDRQHIIKHSEVIPTGCPDALDIDRIVREAGGQAGTVAVDPATFTQLVDKSTKYDAFVAGGFNSIDDVNSKVNSLNQQLQDSQNALDALKRLDLQKDEDISNLQKQLDSSGLQSQVDDLTKQVKSLQAINTILNGKLSAAYGELVLFGWHTGLFYIKSN